ncbi:MAG: recombinase family protein [Bdellovibrionales bacterium]|nr:recombinase family protein [Bdellovibrionales bacterium]
MTATTKRTALYARVSTADQHSGLEAQIRTLKEFCEKSKIENFELFADENISGAKASRPGLDRMMQACRSGEIERVVVYSFSRFARSTTHLLSALEEFRPLNIQFLSITEQIDTNSPMGRAFFTVIAAIAQLERELIVERVKNGLKNAKAKGKHIGRKKTRNSEILRVLIKRGLPYRVISSIASCSHGAVWAEKRAILLEEQAAKKKAEEQKNATEFFFRDLDAGASPVPPANPQVSEGPRTRDVENSVGTEAW